MDGAKQHKQWARERLVVDCQYNPCARVSNLTDMCSPDKFSVRALDRAIKHGDDLSFEQAFAGMCYAIAATNSYFYRWNRDLLSKSYDRMLSAHHMLAIGAAFLQLMASKESFKYLSPPEIAGMTAATMNDLIVQLDIPRVIETCGMGGDIGFKNGYTVKKSINVSTLSSLVLSALGLPTMKHGSYGNTSAIGSTEAIELFGAKTSLISLSQITRMWNDCAYIYLDAHLVKTAHDLSHLLMMETINHVVGPMSIPVSKSTEITKIMGVNEKLHPGDVAQAYTLLHRKGIQTMGGVIVVAGMDGHYHHGLSDNTTSMKFHCILDELSPFGSVVAFAYKGDYWGSHFLTPQDFGIHIDPESIQIPNTEGSLRSANESALRGENIALSSYLAMNAALGLFAFNYMQLGNAMEESGPNRMYLKECYAQCLDVIRSGAAWKKLQDYVESSNS